MAKNNPDKSYGWHKAQDFGDYIEKVIGEINMKFISIVIISILPSGEYGQELKKKFADKDETDYLDSLKFCADLVWNGYFVLSFILIIMFLNLDPLPRVPGEAGGRPSKARHRPGQHRRPRHRPSQPPSCCSSQDL